MQSGHTSGSDWEKISLSTDKILLTRDTYPKRDHTCSKQTCNPLSEQDLVNMRLLPPRSPIIHPAVYVCKYQTVHICTQSDCTEYYGTQDGVCPLTGIYHGHTEGEKYWVMPDKRTAHFKKNGVKGLSGLDARTIQQGTLGLARQNLEDNISLRDGEKTVAQKIADRKNDALLEEAMQELARYNNSMEKTIKTEAVLRPPSPIRIKLEPLVPEQQQPQQIIEQPPASNPIVKKRVVRKRRRDYGRIAEEIVVELLYSQSRKSLNAIKSAKLKEEEIKHIDRYYESRKQTGVIPVLMHVVAITAAMQVRPPSMLVLERDPRRIAYYVKVILHSWKVVTESPWGKENVGAKFESHALSVLYGMGGGICVGKEMFIPKDFYLFLHLPLRPDLVHYEGGFHSAIITKGVKDIKAAYVSAIEAGTSLDQLRVPVD